MRRVDTERWRKPGRRDSPEWPLHVLGSPTARLRLPGLLRTRARNPRWIERERCARAAWRGCCCWLWRHTVLMHVPRMASATMARAKVTILVTQAGLRRWIRHKEAATAAVAGAAIRATTPPAVTAARTAGTGLAKPTAAAQLATAPAATTARSAAGPPAATVARASMGRALPLAAVTAVPAPAPGTQDTNRATHQYRAEQRRLRRTQPAVAARRPISSCARRNATLDGLAATIRACSCAALTASTVAAC